MPNNAQSVMFGPDAAQNFWAKPIDDQIRQLSAIAPGKTRGLSKQDWQQIISKQKPKADQLFGNIGGGPPVATPPPSTPAAPPVTDKGLGYAAERGAVAGEKAISHLTGNITRAAAKVTGSEFLKRQADVQRGHEAADTEWLEKNPQATGEGARGWMEKLLEGTTEGAVSAIPYAAASSPVGIGMISAAEHANEGVVPAVVEGVKSAAGGKVLGKLSEKLTPAVERVLGSTGSKLPDVVKRAIAPGTASAIYDYVLGGGDPASAASAGIVGGVQGARVAKEKPPETARKSAPPTVTNNGKPASSAPTPLFREALDLWEKRHTQATPPVWPKAAPPKTEPVKVATKTPAEQLAEARAENARLRDGAPPKTEPAKTTAPAKTEEKPVAPAPVVTEPAKPVTPEPAATTAPEPAPLHADTHHEVSDVIATARQAGIGKITIMSDNGNTVEVDLNNPKATLGPRTEESEKVSRELGPSKELTITATENSQGLKPWKRVVSGAQEKLLGDEGAAKAVNLDAKLPEELAGAKPRYKTLILTFPNDIDRAAYITAQEKPSKRDADYLKFAMDSTGMSESEVRSHGRKIRAALKKLENRADENGDIRVPNYARTTFGKSQNAGGRVVSMPPAKNRSLG